MIYGYARVSTDGQSVAAQVAGLRAAGAGKVFREVASGAKTDRAQLRKAIAALQAGDVLMVTRLDRLARSTRDLLNTLAAITGSKAGFRSLGDAWADTTTAHGRLMLTVLGGLADDAASAIMRSDPVKASVEPGLWRRSAPHSAVIVRRRSIIAIDRNPCFHMPWRSPRGAPGDAPPCRRHRPLGIAGHRHDPPPRVRAPQRGAACAICSWMRQFGLGFTGLSLIFQSAPLPPPAPPVLFRPHLHLPSNHRLTSVADIHVLHNNRLPPAAADLPSRTTIPKARSGVALKNIGRGIPAIHLAVITIR